MSDPEGLSSEKVSPLPASPLEAAANGHQATEEESRRRDEEEKEEEKEEEEEMASSAHLEPSTLPWPGDKDLKLQMGANSALLTDEVLEPKDKNVAEVQDAAEEEGSAKKTRSRWRESMPEGEKWRDDEVEVQHEGRGDGSLADDEDEGDDDDHEEEEGWISRGFTPEVTIVRPSCKVQPDERQPFLQREEAPVGMDAASPYYRHYEEEDDKYCKYPILSASSLYLI